MLIRLRSRDGLERVQVDDRASVQALRQQIAASLGIPEDAVTLSKDQKLLTAKQPEAFTDLGNAALSLAAAGIQHGDMVFMHYPFAREIAPAVRPSVFDSRSFGSKMTVDELIARQTRIERQETAHCASVSFDRNAANVFQSYIASALGFSIKRGGLLYGTVDAEGHVLAQAIFEPPQSGTADSLELERGTQQEAAADAIAAALGWKKVGWIFSQAAGERPYILSAAEVAQMAGIQQELGEGAVTGVVSVGEGGSVHFEAFQVSDQCARLAADGWFQPPPQAGPPSGTLQLRDPREPKKKDPVIVAGKDVGEVDVDYFLLPIGIRDHEGPLGAAFPVENRLLPQGPAELREHMRAAARLPYARRLADFHLLLWLAGQAGFAEADLQAIAAAAAQGGEIPEGYSLIIDSLAMG